MAPGQSRRFVIGSHSGATRRLEVGDAPRLIAIVGITDDRQSMPAEVAKVDLAQRLGTSVIADVSTCGDLSRIHSELRQATSLPLSTVPIYEIHKTAKERGVWNSDFPLSLVLEVIEQQAERGVDCITLHASYPRRLLATVEGSRRRVKIQGRGGGMIHEFMRTTGRENPILESFDEILDRLAQFEIALSLGNCLRSGTVDDPLDQLIDEEIMIWSDLVQRATAKGVNVMVEGGSHLRMPALAPYVAKVLNKCDGAPLRMLGPLATERGLGYDHITGAITAVEAIRHGAKLLTVVTRAEHIGLPDLDDLREAVVAYRIAVELATQPEIPSRADTTFTCGLGFEALDSRDFFDIERAVDLKAQKSNGDLRACSICNESCRMRISGTRLRADRNERERDVGRTT